MQRKTKHKVLASVDSDGEEHCGGSNSATWNSEDYDFDDQTGSMVINESVILFPSRSEGRVAVKDSYLLPETVQRIYGETISALNDDQRVLTGIGIRALVETICKDKNAPVPT